MGEKVYMPDGGYLIIDGGGSNSSSKSKKNGLDLKVIRKRYKLIETEFQNAQARVDELDALVKEMHDQKLWYGGQRAKKAYDKLDLATNNNYKKIATINNSLTEMVENLGVNVKSL